MIPQLQRREYVLATGVIAVFAVLLAMFISRIFLQAEAKEQAALLKWQGLEQQLQTYHRMQNQIGLATGFQRSKENVLKRVQRSLQDTGIAAGQLRGVRPREERVLSNGAAVRQVVMVELTRLSPSDIGAWLQYWAKPANPWRITGMTWRHHGGSGAQAQSGNYFDLQLSCAAVLMQ